MKYSRIVCVSLVSLGLSLALSVVPWLTPRLAHADPPAVRTTAHPAAPGTVPAHVVPPSGVPTPPEGVVNINTGSEDELTRLPGIGPARAHAIVQLRDRVHQFTHTEDLLRVRGIGRVGFRHLRPYVTLTGPTTLTSRPGRPPRPSDDGISLQGSAPP